MINRPRSLLHKESFRYQRIALGIIIVDGKLFLGMRSKNKPFAGYMEFPGGKCLENEESDICLIRELEEELSIIVTKYHLFSQLSDRYHETRYFRSIFLITQFQGAIEYHHEYEKANFFSVEELKTLKHLPGNEVIIDVLAKRGLIR